MMLRATWYDWSTTARSLFAVRPTWKWRMPGMFFRYLLAPAMSSSAAFGSPGLVQKMTTCENMGALKWKAAWKCKLQNEKCKLQIVSARTRNPDESEATKKAK